MVCSKNYGNKNKKRGENRKGGKKRRDRGREGRREKVKQKGRLPPFR